MIQVLLGSLLLSVIHASIPNHWLPLVAVARAQRWSRYQALVMTAVTGIAHSSSTILMGIFVGLLGYTLSANALMTSIIPAVVLVGLGILYLVLDRRAGHRHHRHTESEHQGKKASNLSIVASLSVAMFFSPCIEIEAYYLRAGFLGWHGITIVSLVYLVVTVLGMVALVDLGLRGARRIRSEYLEHHEKKVTGLVLVALGALTWFVEL